MKDRGLIADTETRSCHIVDWAGIRCAPRVGLPLGTGRTVYWPKLAGHETKMSGGYVVESIESVACQRGLQRNSAWSHGEVAFDDSKESHCDYW